MMLQIKFLWADEISIYKILRNIDEIHIAGINSGRVN